MPGTEPWSGATYPLLGEANDVPADFLAFITAIKHQLVLKADDVADRNARLSGVPSGTLVSCEALATVWMKSDTGWLTVFENPAAVTSGVATPGVDYTITSQWGQRRNGALHVKVLLAYGGSDFTVASDGNFTDVTVATLTADWKPPVNWSPYSIRSNVAGWFGAVSSSTGQVILQHGVSGAKLRNGDFLEVICSYPAP